MKRFLARSLKHFKGNAAGTTKHAALWLAAQVRRNRPELWSKAALEAEASEPLPSKGEGGVEGEGGAAGGGAADAADAADAAEGIELSDDDDDEAETAAAAAAAAAADGALGDGEEGEEGAEGAEGAAAEEGEEGDGEEGEEEVVEPGEVDVKLWEGAATEGWAVQPKGKQGRKWSNWIYFGPSGTRYNTKAEAEAGREFESSATAAADLAKLEVLQQEAQTPEELVGARVSVLWQEEGAPVSKKGPKDEDWFAGQLVGYDGD